VEILIGQSAGRKPDRAQSQSSRLRLRAKYSTLSGKLKKANLPISIMEIYFPNISQQKTLVEASGGTIMRVLKFDI
jgi:hypothetical protein